MIVEPDPGPREGIGDGGFYRFVAAGPENSPDIVGYYKKNVFHKKSI